MACCARPDGRLCLVLILILVLAALPAAASVYRVGILDLEGHGNLDLTEWEPLNDAVFREVAAALPEGPWEAVPRSVLRFQMAELGKNPSECLQDECFLGLGKSLELDLLVAGFFRQTASEDRILLKLYDMNSGQMEGFTRVAGSMTDVLLNSLPQSCHRLLHRYRQMATVAEEAAAVEDAMTASDDQTGAWSPPEGGESLVGSSSKDPIPPPPAPEAAPASPFSAWSLGAMISTYSGPSHSGLLTHINRSMGVMGDLVTPFSDFPVSTPVGLRLTRRIQPPLTLVATYSLSQYFTKASFKPHEWESDRSLETNLHELTVGIQFALDFVRSATMVPYMGGGINFIYADSCLEIDLVNVNEVPIEEGGELMPDQNFQIKSGDFSVGAVGFLGILYRIAPHVALQGELQGQMGQISQHFDYEGSLKYINPDHTGLDNPAVNDMLWGSYPLDLNGLKLSIGILIGL